MSGINGNDSGNEADLSEESIGKDKDDKDNKDEDKKEKKKGNGHENESTTSSKSESGSDNDSENEDRAKRGAPNKKTVDLNVDIDDFELGEEITFCNDKEEGGRLCVLCCIFVIAVVIGIFFGIFVGKPYLLEQAAAMQAYK
ncbi:hypothetical protein RFI_31149 [Reticulomyxa filosa]|uniref:Uncharacterized protein n=1 Tax=Reticulomyxa filosa TaxID=46433 RepID=X6LWD0_RETFI|nr:hypothetical protein RFI_31149 [Reticulomyxa filosa]|eukprot:ETO06248.1 hypothetical protein RFI_31149 [Reticulomyxa filosa]